MTAYVRTESRSLYVGIHPLLTVEASPLYGRNFEQLAHCISYDESAPIPGFCRGREMPTIKKRVLLVEALISRFLGFFHV